MRPMLPPIAKIGIAALWGGAAMLADSNLEAVIVYAGVLFYLISAGCFRDHFRFILIAGLPLLAALLLTWGLVMPAAHATGSADGWADVLQALLRWTRILALAATCQWVLLPLVRRPLQLRAFVRDLGMPASAGVLLAVPILVLPEVQRQIRQVVDARRAQQFPTHGLRGALALPGTIVPVLAALIETSLNRAELWEHRGLLTDGHVVPGMGWISPFSAWPPAILPAVLIWWELAT